MRGMLSFVLGVLLLCHATLGYCPGGVSKHQIGEGGVTGLCAPSAPPLPRRDVSVQAQIPRIQRDTPEESCKSCAYCLHSSVRASPRKWPR
jgi:hypothetical protein